jgi:hypothetical protein
MIRGYKKHAGKPDKWESQCSQNKWTE